MPVPKLPLPSRPHAPGGPNPTHPRDPSYSLTLPAALASPAMARAATPHS